VRKSHFGDVDAPTTEFYTGGPISPGPTSVHEMGYAPLPDETSLTYQVCLVSNSDERLRACGTKWFTLIGTSNHCPCQPDTCSSRGACATTIADGCGATLTCGGCSDGSSCFEAHLTAGDGLPTESFGHPGDGF
jgi:hypothetical protein